MIKTPSYLIIFAIIIPLVGFFFVGHSDTAESQRLYPKLANYYLKTPISDSDVPQLAKWDLLIFGMQAQETSPEQIKKIRQLNPKVKILAYTSSEDFPMGHYGLIESSNGPWHQLLTGISDSWWLLKPDGSHFAAWPGNWSMNVTNQAPVNAAGERWNDYLPQFMHDKIMSSGLWDGIFYDNVWDSASWVVDGNMDINRDGVKDEATWLNAQWKEGMNKMLSNSRRLEGPNAIIMGNCRAQFTDSLNGCLQEDLYGYYGWAQEQNFYNTDLNSGIQPRTTILNKTTFNTGKNDDYQAVRFSLASTLLNNGYYSADWGTQSHGETWWYDEYNIDLGQPISAAYSVDDSQSLNIHAGLWRRDFTKGAVFVNSSDQVKVVSLSEEVEKISGSQDPVVNDGTKVNLIRLAPKEGLIVYKPLFEIIGSPFINSWFARVFDAQGNRERNGFYTYKKRYPGSAQIIITDIDNDGDLETIVADKSSVEIFGSGGGSQAKFYPYTDKFNKGINIAIGDINGDGALEIVTGTDKGGGPQIRIFNRDGKLINPGFFAYGKDYRGGVNVALGDLNGDGVDEIIAGAGVGGGPQIRIFDQNGKVLSAGWFAYDKNFRGGVNVAAGDLNGDGKDEIVSGPGYGGGPEVKVWNGSGQQIGQSFMAFDRANRSGIEVLINDVDGNGTADILAESLNY